MGRVWLFARTHTHTDKFATKFRVGFGVNLNTIKYDSFFNNNLILGIK